MKLAFVALAAVLSSSPVLAQSASAPGAELANSNSSFLVKMTSSMSATASKPGDVVTGEVIDPVALRGARVVGTIDRADHDILGFSFHTLTLRGKSYPIQSKLLSITSSKGNEGRDDLNQRIRMEGAGLIAYGTTTALDEGAEVRVSAWKK